MTLEEINKKLERKDLMPEFRKALIIKKHILLNDKEIEK